MERLSAEEAAARLNPDDRLGLPLGPGQPPTFMAALGERDDWTDLRVYGALLSVGPSSSTARSQLLSGFFGPFERALRDAGADDQLRPGRLPPLRPALRGEEPRVMCTVASAPDADGYCSLSLHAGGSIGEIMRAADDPDRLLVVEASSGFPRTTACRPSSRTGSTSTSDVLVESDAAPLELPEPEPSEVERAIADQRSGVHRRRGPPFRPGSAPSPPRSPRCSPMATMPTSASTRRCSPTGSCGCTRPGRVSNRKGIFDGDSIATFALGTSELYEWLDGNEDVAFLPVEVVNSPETIAANRKMISINAAMAVDVHGQVVADTINGRQYSGIGGAEDFAAGPGLDAGGPLAALPALHRRDRRRVALADRPLVRARRRDHRPRATRPT